MGAFLVLPSLAVGGMEKRLAEVWQKLASEGMPVNLVLPAPLRALLARQPELGDIERWSERIIPIHPKDDSYPALVRALLPVIRTAPRGSVFHYLLQGVPLLHRLLGHRTIISWVATSLPRPAPQRRELTFWAMSRLSFQSADIIDVLNPHILRELSGSPRLAPKLRLTHGGTFVDFDRYRPAAIKKNWVAFVGRLESGKGALDFARALPLVAQRLGPDLPTDLRFIFIGRDGDEAHAVRGLLDAPKYRNLPVSLSGHLDDPGSVLAEAKVFVSLQKISNYPSKALAEAMACGAVPVITDVVDSRLMADERLAAFVPAPVDPEWLADEIAAILKMDEASFGQRSRAVRADAQERFSLDRQAEYFADLYRELGAFA